MPNTTNPIHQIQYVHNFQDLVETLFQGDTNAICWSRELMGDFEEIVNSIEVDDNMVELHPDDLLELVLSEQGQLACDILLNDLQLLEAHGASPSLNIINYLDILFKLTPYSGHIDPPDDLVVYAA
ncbi:MAG: hypothetical protein IPN86_22975 [Saprospiraceae bacterium]|nr:hypothetical protein [Saprospiraceae bacterium]